MSQLCLYLWFVAHGIQCPLWCAFYFDQRRTSAHSPLSLFLTGNTIGLFTCVYGPAARLVAGES